MKISTPITKAYSGPPRRASGIVRYAISALGILALIFYIRKISIVLVFLPSSPGHYHSAQTHLPPKFFEDTKIRQESAHPVAKLIQDAQLSFESLLAKQIHNLTAAASIYREKRGRHPPPGFDLWFEFAQSKGAIIVEDFFDQIYHDLMPFWALKPSIMRQKAQSFEMTISVRNNKASAKSNWFWTQIWLDLIKSIQHLLPDMDIALNAMDEPRLVVPWEKINEFMEVERKKRNMPPSTGVVSNFSRLSPPTPQNSDLFTWESGENKTFWEILIQACHPNSPARKAAIRKDFNHSPTLTLKYTRRHTYKGYVSNVTAAADFCYQPDLQGLHGIMIKPLSISSTSDLFPMFGGSKLQTNNEILLPAPVYWSNEARFSGGNHHGGSWEQKLDQVIWRGVATGGRSNASNWKGFQRHRFVAMTNGTKIASFEKQHSIPENWALPPSHYNLAAQSENRLGEWTSKWADTGFVDLNCDPRENLTCRYTSPHFHLVPGMMMAEQFHRKYLPDIDGNSFSGRYRGFLLSTSLPIKSTIFREWHDCRLVPWKHFVPMDNRFIDFWGIMQYFLGYEGNNIKISGHDDQAKKIALDGQEWANRVLRPEDMQIYVLRLLLEYARLSDDRRDDMGWVDDLF